MSMYINAASNLELAIGMTERQNHQAAEIGLFDPIVPAPERPSPNLQKIMRIVVKFKKNTKPVMEEFE
jgi:hypothetical protein